MRQRKRILPYIFAAVMLLVAIAPQLAYAEGEPLVQYAKNFGGSVGDRFYGVAATPDGGTVLVGYSTGISTNLGGHNWENRGYTDGIIVKLDADGDVEWTKNLGGTGSDEFRAVAVLADGSIVAVGYSTGASANLANNWTNLGNFDAIIVKLDGDGTVQWSKNLGGAETDSFRAVTVLPDGSIVAVGFSTGASTNLDTNNWTNLGNTDALIVKMDTDGTVQWSKNLGGAEAEAFYAVIALSDGSIVAVGYSEGVSTNLDTNNWANEDSQDGIVVKLDTDGDVQWSKNLGGIEIEAFNAVTALSDGSIVAAGDSRGASTNLDTNNWTNLGSYDGIVVKLDADGDVQWSKNLGGAGIESFNALTALPDGSIVAVGYSNNISTNLDTNNWANQGGNDAIVIKMDTDGSVQWSKNLGGAGYDSCQGVTVTPDGSIVAVAFSNGASTNLDTNNWANAGDYDAIAVRLNLAYTLTINDGKGGSTTQTVYSGQKLTAPTTPTRDGFTFTGWYTEAGLNTKWNFDTGTVSGNVTLYAGWQADEGTPDPTPTPTITPGPTAPPTGDAGSGDGWMWMILLAAGILGIYVAVRRIKERE